MLVRIALVALLGLAVSACAMGPMPAQQPTLNNLQALRSKDIPPVALGDFALAPGLPKRMDRVIVIRAGTVSAPGDGSFAHHLKQTLEAELKAAGKLDPASPVVISGELTRSAVTTNLPNSKGELGARFTVVRGGAQVYQRELVVNGEWESNFLGAIAIPEAMDRYTALYPDLVGALIKDPEFRAAVGAP